MPNQPFDCAQFCTNTLVKGDRVYPTLDAKQAALEPILRAWQANPARVRQLCGWDWIRETLTALPADTQAS